MSALSSRGRLLDCCSAAASASLPCTPTAAARPLLPPEGAPADAPTLAAAPPGLSSAFLAAVLRRCMAAARLRGVGWLASVLCSTCSQAATCAKPVPCISMHAPSMHLQHRICQPWCKQHVDRRHSRPWQRGRCLPENLGIGEAHQPGCQGVAASLPEVCGRLQSMPLQAQGGCKGSHGRAFQPSRALKGESGGGRQPLCSLLARAVIAWVACLFLSGTSRCCAADNSRTAALKVSWLASAPWPHQLLKARRR